MQQLLSTFRGAVVWEFQIQKCCYLLWLLFGFLELNSLMEMDFRWLQAFPWSTFLSRFRCCACWGDSVLNVTKTKSAIQKVSNRNHVIACFWKIPSQQDATCGHSERSVRNSQRARSGAQGYHGSFWKGVAISTYYPGYTRYTKNIKKQGWICWMRHSEPFRYGPTIWGSGRLKQRRLDKSGFPKSAFTAGSLHSSFSSCWTVHNRH